MIFMQKQTMTCVFTPANGAPPEPYLGRVDEFGVALGAVNQGHLVWGVIAPSTGVPHGALSGTYGGVGAQATAGAGVGANVLVGGSGRAFSLQPIFGPGSDRPQPRWRSNNGHSAAAAAAAVEIIDCLPTRSRPPTAESGVEQAAPIAESTIGSGFAAAELDA